MAAPVLVTSITFCALFIARITIPALMATLIGALVPAGVVVSGGAVMPDAAATAAESASSPPTGSAASRPTRVSRNINREKEQQGHENSQDF